MFGALNLHIHPDTSIEMSGRPGSHMLKLHEAVVYPYVAVYFDDIADLRRLRDAIDAHLVGPLSEDT